MPKSEVLTSIQLTGNPEWSAIDLKDSTGNRNILVQDEDLKIGIVGTPESIITMCDRIKAVVSQPINATSILAKIGASLDDRRSPNNSL